MLDQEEDDYGTDEYCTCDMYDYEEHTCPFSEESDNDYESLCNCCAFCQHQCAMDI